MSDVMAVALLILFGPGALAYTGYLVRYDGWREAVPALEAVIDKALGLAHPPRNRVDHAFMLFQLVMMAILGVIVTCLGIFIVISDFGLLE